MKAKNSEISEILTVKQLADYRKMDEHTIYRLAKEGEILAMKIGVEWRFKKNLIDKWIEEESFNSLKRKGL